MKVFSNFTLKLMAIFFMVMDHIYTYLNGVGNIRVPIWFGYIGKLAAPIFFYLIVEGFYHTRSRVKYMKRLFSMGIVMIIIDLILGIRNNIFLSLGCGIALMGIIEYTKKQERYSNEFILGVLGGVIMTLLSLITEASIYGLIMILIFYLLREKKLMMACLYIIFSLIWLLTFIGPSFIEGAFLWDYQWMMVFAIIPILLYNGELGYSTKPIKTLFYWFYPIHLTVILVVSKIISIYI